MTYPSWSSDLGVRSLLVRPTARFGRALNTLSLIATLTACGGPAETLGPNGPGDGDHEGGDGEGNGDGDSSDTGDGDSTGDGDGDGSSGTDGGTITKGPYALDQCGSKNPAGLSSDKVDKLLAGGSASGMRYLYPYEGTVFPRGLKAPLVMWEGGAADAIYVHLHAGDFDYKGCLKPNAEGQLQLPQDVWGQAGAHTKGASDPFELELTTLSGSTAKGPIKRKIVIAQATLSGSIFYNSYNSGGTGGAGLPGLGGNGSVNRIRPGKDFETFARTGTCTGCHSVSANGSRLIARELMSLQEGSVYKITPTTAANPAPSRAATGSSFVGLFPDGSVYVSSAARDGVGPLLQGGIGITPNADARMFETDTGTEVTGTGIPVTAMMPTFSPDGTLLAFNDYAQGSGHTISIMGYDPKTRKASGAKALYNNADGYPGWPFLLPDNGAIVFALGVDQVYDGNGAGISPIITTGPRSDLAILDVASKKATLLARAMGFNTPADADADKTYLPFGTAEAHQAYYPTVSPVASGGYFWVFFDAMRHYGNKGNKRQLWGTAVLISKDGKYTGDPSHPAFYLSGQNIDSANHRAFTALDPCKTDGGSCKSGADCCGGYCNFPDLGGEFNSDPVGMCSSTPKECAADGERCRDASDCCNSDSTQCINGYCGAVILL